MKLILSLPLILISVICNAQADLQKKFNQDVCHCIDSVTKEKPIDKNIFSGCFQQSVFLNSNAIVSETLKVYGDSTYESGYKFGTMMAKKAMVDLVSECTGYFLLTDSLRYNEYEDLNKDSLLEELRTIEAMTNPGFDMLNEKSKIYFILKKYDESLAVLESILEKDPSPARNMFLKAWIFEIKGRYDEAIDLYEQAAVRSGVAQFYIYAEIAKRKKKGI